MYITLPYHLDYHGLPFCFLSVDFDKTKKFVLDTNKLKKFSRDLQKFSKMYMLDTEVKK